MTRKQFLTELDLRLSVLPKEEADKHLVYYAEILADRVEDGMTDEEAVASLESLDTIAARILGAQYTEPKQDPTDRRRALTTVALILAITVPLLIIGNVFLSNLAFDRAFSSGSVMTESVPIVIDDTTGTAVISIPADGIRNIDITWISENVSITVWDEDYILLENSSDGTALQYEIDDDTLVMDQSENFFSSGSPVILTLPRALVEQGLKNLTISVTSSSVSILDVSAEELDLSSVSGSFDITGAFDEVDVETTSGTVNFSGSFRSGSFDSMSGSMYVTTQSAPETIRADSVSGTVSLTLPEHVGYTVDFDTISGSFDSDRYTHGDGSSEIRVETVSGTLSIYRY